MDTSQITENVSSKVSSLVPSIPSREVLSTGIPSAPVAGLPLTDYKLSLAKVVPIEVHEVADHGVGLAASIGPFALGFAKREPLLSTFAVMLGASQVFASLITDYRARKGVTWGLPLARAV